MGYSQANIIDQVIFLVISGFITFVFQVLIVLITKYLNNNDDNINLTSISNKFITHKIIIQQHNANQSITNNSRFNLNNANQRSKIFTVEPLIAIILVLFGSIFGEIAAQSIWEAGFNDIITIANGIYVNISKIFFMIVAFLLIVNYLKKRKILAIFSGAIGYYIISTQYFEELLLDANLNNLYIDRVLNTAFILFIIILMTWIISLIVRRDPVS
jgi:hypothetical protein